ncbi:MAG TPA: hypothetical protein VGO52_08280 [Hyphomonadaceae bacterium]|jgi:hypothetical protein|nr:hypothetical protein [Hyphomonadaceae bacterium]
MTQTRRMLCIFYGLAALCALIATWSGDILGLALTTLAVLGMCAYILT